MQFLKVLKMYDNMALNANSEDTISNALCASCKDEETSVLAEKYCVDCGESLCARCLRISHRSKHFHDHTIVDLQTDTRTNKDNQSTLHALSEYLRCSDHPNNCVPFLCTDDSIMCCTECAIENHRHCKNLEKIEALSSKSENKSTIRKTKGRAEDIMSQIKGLIDFKKHNWSENVAEVQKKAELLTDTLKEIRTKINSLFDVLEESIVSKVKAISKKCVMEVEEENSKLKDICTSVTGYLAVIDQAVTAASNNQTFVILSKIALRIEEAEKAVLEACRNCGKYAIDLKLKPTLQTLSGLGINDTDQLAEVTEEFEKTAAPHEELSYWRFTSKVFRFRPEERENLQRDYKPEIYFKPVVPLPAFVTVKTEEEGEEKSFSERAKLFRFDTESKQWKERGIGDLKILKHKKKGRVRIFMRREQVLKVCANHTISNETKLAPMSSSDKACCWNAMDYSDGEMKREQLAAKFKSSDKAARFKEVIEECLLGIAAAEKKPDVDETEPNTK